MGPAWAADYEHQDEDPTLHLYSVSCSKDDPTETDGARLVAYSEKQARGFVQKRLDKYFAENPILEDEPPVNSEDFQFTRLGVMKAGLFL